MSKDSDLGQMNSFQNVPNLQQLLFCISEAGEILGLRAAVRGRPSLLLRTKPIWKGELRAAEPLLLIVFLLHF